MLGVNSRAELAEAEAVMQQRLRAKAMAGGATLIAPETVFLSHDTQIGKDVVIEPHVVIGERVVIEDGATIKSFCYMEKSRIGPGATVGPFARLRPGVDSRPRTRISAISSRSSSPRSARAPRLTTSLISAMPAWAPRANIGAGTITCNYDGFDKHRTEIGAGAFIGSNSSLVAPVKIGEGAYIGSGSVISKDVSARRAGALAQRRRKSGKAGRRKGARAAQRRLEAGRKQEDIERELRHETAPISD